MPKKKVKEPIKNIPNNSRMSWHYFLGDKGGCSHIRCIFPSMLCNIHKFDNISSQLLLSHGMKYIIDKNFYNDKLFVTFQRSATENQLQFMEYFIKNIQSETKTAIIYEIDDDLIDVPEWNMAHDYYKNNRKFSTSMIKKSNGITTSTEYLAKKMRKYNKNVVVNLNHLPKFIWGEIPWPKNINDKPRMFWGGSANHFALANSGKIGGDIGKDLIKYIKTTINDYQWVFLGAIPNELDDVKDKIEFHKWQSPLHYPNYLKSLNIDIGIAPLMDCEFNKSKSNIKSLEYTAAGIPGVYSNIEPYSNLTMTAETDEYFIDCIESMVDNDNKRNYVFERDHNILKDQIFWEDNNNIEKYIDNHLKLFNMQIPKE